MPQLKLTSIAYNSPGDEKAFFAWLEGIPSVERVWGSGADLFVEIKYQAIPDEDLREFIALLTRYAADLSQLRQFLTDQNKHWFQKTLDAYWHQSIFPD